MLEVLDEVGNIYANFRIKKINNMYEYKINQTFIIDENIAYNRTAAPCVARIYKQLSDACDSDATCSMLCNLNWSYNGMLAAWAVAYCASL